MHDFGDFVKYNIVIYVNILTINLLVKLLRHRADHPDGIVIVVVVEVFSIRVDNGKVAGLQGLLFSSFVD